MDHQSLFRPGILKVRPYAPGKPVSEVKRELGLSDVIKLASNENPEGPLPEVVAEVAERDPMSRKVYESFRKFRDQAIAWHNVSERAYLNARSL